MKRLILAAVAVLALAGAAASQPENGQAFYGNTPMDQTTYSNGGPPFAAGYGPSAYARRDPKRVAVLAGALRQYQMACKPDQLSLCSDKKGDNIDQCLAYYRLKLSSPCKQAITQLVVARRDAS